jgi:hypothetical protein
MVKEAYMMKLDEFITQTINQIIDGVAASQEHAVEKAAWINPPIIASRVMSLPESNLSPAQPIEFDIAITTTKTSEAKGGAGIFVAGVGIGAQAEAGTAGMNVSRIKFTIPVILPSQGILG